MVCIENFTKWVPPLSKSSKDSGVLKGVLSGYGALREILTDKGRECMGEFLTLLNKHEITHRRASRENPQSYGLT